ncbi:MAG: ABC transporter permease [Thermoplasmata archaeon]
MDKEQNDEQRDKRDIDRKVDEEILKKDVSPWMDAIKRRWYKFRANRLSILGLSIVLICVFLAIFADFITPHPSHVGYYHNYDAAFIEPFKTLKYPLGTDQYGRGILTRIIFGFRYSFRMAAVVLTLVVPTGTILGLIAGYNKNTWIDTLIMRSSDIFVAVPPLVLALSITSMMEASAENAMFAISLGWWPWYTRITYNNVSSLVNEDYIRASELMGASKLHIMFRELFPNSMGPILTKATLDVGLVILIGASLSFVGLGAQPPTPDLGTMVAKGSEWLPSYWWVTVFPAIAISFIIFGANLLGDGIQDAFEEGG